MDRSCPIHDSRRREAERDAQDRQEVRDPEERDAVGDRGGNERDPDDGEADVEERGGQYAITRVTVRVKMPRSPCFVVILSDDQAACDLGCLGATDLLTPNLDRLAASGAILRSWYSNSPVCSPSRASLLTGRYPGNAGVRSILRGHRPAIGLPADVPTLAGVLRPLGYRTALYGKWHLGVREGSRPHDRGFDEWFGFLAGCVDYYSHIFYFDMDSGHDPTHDLWEDGREVWRNGEYFTSLVTERAVAFIRRAAHDDVPFFLYVPYSAPHYPMHAPQEHLDRFPGLPGDRRITAAMIAAMDDGVGAILDELERAGLREDSAVFFQSDNGPSRETRNWLNGR